MLISARRCFQYLAPVPVSGNVAGRLSSARSLPDLRWSTSKRASELRRGPDPKPGWACSTSSAGAPRRFVGLG